MRLTYPFRTDVSLREAYQKYSGGVRIGKMLEDMDAFVALVAHAHCETDGTHPNIVTARVDEIQFGAAANCEHTALHNLELRGQVIWTGRSSMLCCSETFVMESFHESCWDQAGREGGGRR